jgi:WD40 repeat protein
MQTVVQRGHELAVLSVAISPASNFVATGSRGKTAKLCDLITGNRDGTAKVWEIATGKQVLTVKPKDERVTDVPFHPKRKFFATAGVGNYANVWPLPVKQTDKELPADGYAEPGGKMKLAISQV